MLIILVVEAPITLRIPTSFVLCSVENEERLYNPNKAINSAKIQNEKKIFLNLCS